MKYLVQMFGVIVWVFGIVLAQGWASTAFAVIVPLWSWYLVAEEIFVRYLS